MALEITFFQGAAVGVFASVAIVATYYFQVAKALEKNAEKITTEKSWIVDERFIKCMLSSSLACVQKMFKFASKILGEEKVLQSMEGAPEQFRKFMQMSQKAVMDSIGESAFPKEVLEVIKLDDTQRDEFYALNYLGFALREIIPEKLSEQVDELIKSIIAGVIFGLLFPALDFLLSQEGLTGYWNLVALVISLILVTGYFYVRYGIVGMWSIRKLERKLNRLGKARNIDEVGESIEEIV